jgi:uncharacterized protein (TIGR02246 family)
MANMQARFAGAHRQFSSAGCVAERQRVAAANDFSLLTVLRHTSALMIRTQLCPMTVMKIKPVSGYLCLASGFAGLLLAPLCFAGETAKDEDAIKAVVGAFARAMNAKDVVAFAHVFHADADFTNVVGVSAHGRKAVEEFHRPRFEGDGTKGSSFKNAVLTILSTRIRFIRTDVASVDVAWTMTGAVLNGKTSALRKGLLSWIVTKEEGRWGIAVMHNSEFPADPVKSPGG